MNDNLPKYQVRRVADLIPYARNARTHSDQQIAQIAASIREFGFLNPIITDGDDGVLAGHGRIIALQKLGIDDVPCIDAAHLTEAQRRAYVIADNKLALNAGWDDDMLRVEFADLESEGFDLSLIGFDVDEMAAIINDAEEDEIYPGQGEAQGDGGAGSLAGRFMLPPFTVMNAREGWWQNRKRAWLALGIKSELGRGETASTSARVGANDEATYRTIGGRRSTAAPGGGGKTGVRLQQQAAR